jgi:hypothetical protein
LKLIISETILRPDTRYASDRASSSEIGISHEYTNERKDLRAAR